MYCNQKADQTEDDQHHGNWSNIESQSPPCYLLFSWPGPWATKWYCNNLHGNPQSSCFLGLAISPILGCTLSKVVQASLSYAKHQHRGMMQSHSQLARQTPNPQGHRHLVGPTTGTLPQTSRRFRPRWLHVLGPVISFDQPCLLVMVADVS